MTNNVRLSCRAIGVALTLAAVAFNTVAASAAVRTVKWSFTGVTSIDKQRFTCAEGSANGYWTVDATTWKGSADETYVYVGSTSAGASAVRPTFTLNNASFLSGKELKSVSMTLNVNKSETFDLVYTADLNGYEMDAFQFTGGKATLTKSLAAGSVTDGSITLPCYVGTATRVELYDITIAYDDGTVAAVAPVFSVAAGVVDPGTTVTLSSETEGAAISYTLNGGETTAYIDGIVINGDAGTEFVIEAWASADGIEASEHVTATYSVKATEPAPVISAEFAEQIPAGSEIAILSASGSDNVVIKYAISDSEPAVYDSEMPIIADGALNQNITIRAWCEANGYRVSPVAEHVYFICPELTEDMVVLKWTFSGKTITTQSGFDGYMNNASGSSDGRWNVYGSVPRSSDTQVSADGYGFDNGYIENTAIILPDSAQICYVALSMHFLNPEQSDNSCEWTVTSGKDDAAVSGTMTFGNSTASQQWLALTSEAKQLKFLCNSNVGDISLDGVSVYCSKKSSSEGGDVSTSVETVTVDSAELEYFTLQGVKVEASELTPGIYVVRCGVKTNKIIIR